MHPDVLTVREAAARLGVSGQRVRQLISAGSLRARRSSSGWLIEADDIAAWTRRAHGRPPSPRTVWAVLCTLSSVAGPEQGNLCAITDPRLRYRAKLVLKSMPDPAEDPGRWRALLAPRGRAERMWVHPGLIPKLTGDPQVCAGGSIAAAHIGEGLSETRVRDLYVAEHEAEHVAARYRMRPDPNGQVILHVVPSSVAGTLITLGGGLIPAAAATADLLDEDDPRARRAAVRQLRAMFRALTDEYQPRSPAPSEDVPHGADHAS
jgi:excisionase family DNA binding protein